MARHVRRFRDGQSLSVQAKGSFVNVSSRDKRPQHRVQLRTDPASSLALAGLLACTGSRRDAGDSLQSPRGRCAPGGARGFPLADASGWRARGRHIAARLGARVCGRGTRHPGVQPASHAVHDTRRRVADAGDRRPPVRRMDRCRRFPDVDDGCAAVAPSPSSLVIWSRIEAPCSGSMGGECFAPVEEAWRAIGARGGRKERRIASATFTCRLPKNGRCALGPARIVRRADTVYCVLRVPHSGRGPQGCCETAECSVLSENLVTDNVVRKAVRRADRYISGRRHETFLRRASTRRRPPHNCVMGEACGGARSRKGPTHSQLGASP